MTEETIRITENMFVEDDDVSHILTTNMPKWSHTRNRRNIRERVMWASLAIQLVVLIIFVGIYISSTACKQSSHISSNEVNKFGHDVQDAVSTRTTTKPRKCYTLKNTTGRPDESSGESTRRPSSEETRRPRSNATAIDSLDDLSGGCEHGWTRFRLKCYRVFRCSKCSWYDAKMSCRLLGASLARVTSMEVNDLLLALTDTNYVMVDGTNGGTTDTWIYSDGSKIIFSLWARGQDSPTFKRYRCLEIIKDFTIWNDISCSRKYFNSYACEVRTNETRCPIDWKRLGSTCYRVFVCNMRCSWLDARKRCKSLGGGLARVMSNEISRLLLAMVDKHYILIDGSDEKKEGKWIFTDGTVMEFDLWPRDRDVNKHGLNTGQPSGKRWENCLEMLSNYAGWNDMICTSKYTHSYACEEPTFHQN